MVLDVEFPPRHLVRKWRLAPEAGGAATGVSVCSEYWVARVWLMFGTRCKEVR